MEHAMGIRGAEILLWLAQATPQPLDIDWADYRLGLAIALLVVVGVAAYVVVLYRREK
jgi:hypothetical protein